MKYVVALAAHGKQSGKTTVADYLVQNHGFVRFSFAEILKRMAEPMIEVNFDPGDVKDILYNSDKSTVCFSVNGVNITARHILQTLGTEWGRNQLHRDIWAQIMKDRLLNTQHTKIVIDDLRFPNELDMLKNLDTNTFKVELLKIIRMTPEDYVRTQNKTLMERIADFFNNEPQHPSDQSLPDDAFDNVIYNYQTIEKLYSHVEWALNAKIMLNKQPTLINA